jgi:hypothetical protein
MGSWAFTVWAPRTRTCPATSPSSLRSRTAARRTGVPRSCPAPIRERHRPRRHEGGGDQKRTDQYLVNKGLTPEQQRSNWTCSRTSTAATPRCAARSQLEARIQAFELAFRMQTQAPEASRSKRKVRGDQEALRPRRPRTRDFGWQCLLARRLSRARRPLRAVHPQLQVGPALASCSTSTPRTPRGGQAHRRPAQGPEGPRHVERHAGDLGRRVRPHAGLAGKDGRDHNPYGYTIWMAGAGVKPGFIYGATDDIRLPRGRGPHAHPRLPRDRPAPARP